jgi:ectoine hydroxylase-related dioxygenase (phytanoyl-CoA dioxygenase family)
MRPNPNRWASEQHIHWDMDSALHILDPGSTGLQGVLCLTDCLDKQGGFVCAPGFHHRLEAWAASVSPHRNTQIPTLADVAGMELRSVGAAAGSIIIWSSALPHSNSRNAAAKPRVAQYITFSRAPEASMPFVPAPVPVTAGGAPMLT